MNVWYANSQENNDAKTSFRTDQKSLRFSFLVLLSEEREEQNMIREKYIGIRSAIHEGKSLFLVRLLMKCCIISFLFHHWRILRDRQEHEEEWVKRRSLIGQGAEAWQLG